MKTDTMGSSNDSGIESPAFRRRPWRIPAADLFSAGLFCLILGVAFGAKPVAAGQVLIFLSFVAGFLERGSSAWSWRSLPSSGWCLMGFLLASFASLAANFRQIEAPLEYFWKLRYLLLVVVALGMPWLVRPYLSVKWRRDSLVFAWLVPLSVAVIVGLIGWWNGVHPLRGGGVVDIKRVSGIYGQVMTFAYSLQFSVVLIAAFVLMPRDWRAVTRVPWWICLLLALLFGGALYLTYTRGAMLGTAVGLVVLAAMRSWKLVALIVVIGVICALVSRIDGARYLSMNSDLRLGQWRAASLSFLERPVFGWGYRNFEHHSAELKERYGFEKDVVKGWGKPERLIYFKGHAHNNYLESFASTGVFGGLSFIAFCLAWLGEARRGRHAIFFVPPIAAFLVSGVFENTFFDSEVLNCILLLYLFTRWSGGEDATVFDAGPMPHCGDIQPESISTDPRFSGPEGRPGGIHQG